MTSMEDANSRLQEAIFDNVPDYVRAQIAALMDLKPNLTSFEILNEYLSSLKPEEFSNLLASMSPENGNECEVDDPDSETQYRIAKHVAFAVECVAQGEWEQINDLPNSKLVCISQAAQK